jgi:Domain of unknown function (DUF4382)
VKLHIVFLVIKLAISTRKAGFYMIAGIALAAVLIAAVYTSGVKLPSNSNTQTLSHAGTLIVSIKDAPVDIDELWVTIDSIEVNSAENGWTKLALLDGDIPQNFDLLSLQQTSLDLSKVELPAGNYTKVRLHVRDAYSIVLDGETEVRTDLKVPSGKLDVIISFEIKDGGSTKVLIDMTADWVAISASGNLRPVLKATVSYDTEESSGIQQATSTQTPGQTEEPTATPTAPVESPPVESPPVETSTPETTPTESPPATSPTSV